MISGLLSVIVPAYNASLYIFECINTIISQTYENLEVIIVDDGSTDDTRILVQKIIQEDRRIRYIYQDNKGVSAARNRGVEEANGEFVSFVDADDMITSSFFEDGIKLIIENNLDFVLGQTKIVQELSYESHERVKQQTFEFSIYEKERLNLFEKRVLSNGIVDDRLLDNTFTSGPVCKIFRNETIEEIQFNTSLIRGEDVVFNLELIQKCKKIGIVNKTWYLYRQNENSVTKLYNPEVLRSTGAFIEVLYNMYSMREDMIPFLQVRAIKQIYGALLIGPCSSNSPLSSKQQVKEIRRFFSIDFMKKILSFRSAVFPGSVTDKVFFWLAKYHLCTSFYILLKIYKHIKKK